MVCSFVLLLFVLILPVPNTNTSFQLFGSPYPSVVGVTFELICITTNSYLGISKGSETLLYIIGGYQNGTCKTTGTFNTNYSYYCYPSNYTYKVVIPGTFNRDGDKGIKWICQDLFGGGYAELPHLLAYPNVTIKLKPSDTVFVRKNKPVTFSCNVPIRESWQRTEIVDSVLGKVVSFIRNGTMCLTHGTVLNSYNATCILSTGRFWVELLIASSWYNGQRITCKAQYGIGNTATDLTFEAISTIAISEEHRLVISPSAVAFGSGISVILSCHLNQHQTEITWYMNFTTFKKTIATKSDNGINCVILPMEDDDFEYECDVEGRLFKLVIPSKLVTYGLNDVSWTCGSDDTIKSNAKTFRITDIPGISVTKALVCLSPKTVTLVCNLSASTIEYVQKAVWHHRFQGQTIRSLNGSWDGASFKLRIPFCTIQDTGVYTCSMETDLPNFETLNEEVALSISGLPLFIDKTAIKSKTSVDLTAAFYSFLTSELNVPLWSFKNRTLISGAKYITRTSDGPIKTKFYGKEVQLNGFITTLRILAYGNQDAGEYIVTVQNSISSVMETINVKFSTTSKNDVQHQTGYSGGILAAVAVSCIFGTLIVVLITYIIVQRIRMLKTAKKATSKTNESYDELGLSSLPSVYDTVQQT